MKTGYIKIFRSIEDWGWFNTPGMLEFWIRILLKAGWKDEDGVERGSFITSVSELARESMITDRQARTFLSRLVKTGEIEIGKVRSSTRISTTFGTRIRTKITVCKYESYQSIARDVRQKERQDVRHEYRQEVDTPPYSPSSSSPTPSSSTPPISPNLFEEEKKEGDSVVFPKKRTVDFNLVKKMWNDAMTRKVPKIQGLSEARKEKVKVRVEEMGGWEEARAILQDCFQKVNASDFCNGEGGGDDHKWVATFDWFFSNDKNWMKVSEGNYDNRRQISRFEQSMGVAQRAKNLKRLIYGTGNTGTTDGFADSPDEQ